MKHLVLIGFMASGKSTLAKLLSTSLNLPIFSSDEWIVKQSQMSIAKIFALCGEGGFRDWEMRACEEISSLKERHIIDCGGGFVLKNDVQRLGRVYYLKASLEEIKQRLLQQDQREIRPLANSIENLYFQREEIYTLKACKIIEECNQTQALRAIIEDWKKNS